MSQQINRNNELPLFPPDPQWNADKVEIWDIGPIVSEWGEKNRKRYSKILSNILTQNECQKLIDISEQRGYVKAKINTPYGEIVMLDVRNNDRCIIDSYATMGLVWERIVQALTLQNDHDSYLFHIPSIENRYRQDWHMVGLNERMRFLRYDPGTYFAPHSDGCYIRQGEAGPDRRGEQSFVTLQLYLNNCGPEADFMGGSTNFLNEKNKEEKYRVTPKAGSVLLFQHSIYHEGAEVTRGRKYAIRSDVMYTNRGPGREYSTIPLSLKQI